MGGSWTDKSKRTGKTYGRKPYIKGKTGSYSEMMDTTPRKAMLDQRLEKKSQYDKPYLVDDYAEMEHIQPPPPGILTFEDPEKRKRQRRPVPTGEDLPPPGILCGLVCNPPAFCDGPVQCFFLAYTTAKLSEYLANLKAYIIRDGSTSIARIELLWDNPGGPKPLILIYPPDGVWHVWPDQDMDKIELHAYNIYEGYPVHRCNTSLQVFCRGETCCITLPNGAFAWNTGSNPTTIASGGSANIYVQGGCPSYTYTVSGLGATWYSNGSTSLVSDNLNEQLNLSVGTCGVGYGAVITVSVVDNCNTSTGSLVLRATGTDAQAPGWGGSEFNVGITHNCYNGGCDCYTYCTQALCTTSPPGIQVVVGDQKWTSNVWANLGEHVPPDTRLCDTLSWNAPADHFPPGGADPKAWAQTLGFWDSNACTNYSKVYHCIPNNLVHYHWKCT